MERFTELIFNGAKATNGTLDNAAVVNAGNGQVTIAITAHGLKVGSMIHIAGTTNYDGNYKVKAVPTANGITIDAAFVAETPAGTETYVSGWKMNQPGAIAGIAAKLSAGVGGAELMSIAVDAARGADFDFTVDSHDFNTVTNWAEMYDDRFQFDKNDIIMCTFANSTSKTFGVRLFVEH